MELLRDAQSFPKRRCLESYVFFAQLLNFCVKCLILVQRIIKESPQANLPLESARPVENLSESSAEVFRVKLRC